jgi:hypothetical protein
MAAVMERDELAHVGMRMQGEAAPSCLTTTLYDVIAAIQDELSPDDDELVVATVVHLLQSGRLTWLGKASKHLGQSQCPAIWAMPHVSPRTTAEQSYSTGQR